MPNQLAGASSPYLLQHAENPVDWYPWGPESLERARLEQKPIFLSIGYAACHWCHVMAHESFQDPSTAAFMNEHFINIKVDREERPDLDGIYMQAVQAMTGSGGWPMSVFLTPDLKPFYAGTYFPPVSRFNMPSFRDVLGGVARAWKEEQGEIQRVGAQVKEHLQLGTGQAPSRPILTSAQMDAIAGSLVDNYDWGYGGWGQAPKFPQPMTIEFLLARTARHRELEETLRPRHLKEMEAATHALRVMARGGMYDVVGGGFARYSTDNFWRVPHFEKMLYDNAGLARAYLHAFQLTGDPFFRRVLQSTLDFVQRELTHPQGGFYSSLDADSEGHEGKFYVWSLEELQSVLGEEADFVIAAYGITPQGNWEGTTVLQRALDDAALAARFTLEPVQIPEKLAEAHSRLLAARETRVRPATDDKILAGWNGLMLAAFAESARVLGNESYLQTARQNAEFVLTHLMADGQLRRSWREGNTTPVVFLEDYAALILGLLELYQTDFNPSWFSSAKSLAAEMFARFSDTAGGGFFDTASDGGPLLLRPKELQDNASPCGNSLACETLLKLAAFTGDSQYRDPAEHALPLITENALRFPTAFGNWLTAVEFALRPTKEVALIGSPTDQLFGQMLELVRSEYRPGLVVAASPYPPTSESPALLAERPLLGGQVTAYVCENLVCNLPVTTLQDLQKQL